MSIKHKLCSSQLSQQQDDNCKVDTAYQFSSTQSKQSDSVVIIKCDKRTNNSLTTTTDNFSSPKQTSPQSMGSPWSTQSDIYSSFVYDNSTFLNSSFSIDGDLGRFFDQSETSCTIECCKMSPVKNSISPLTTVHCFSSVRLCDQCVKRHSKRRICRLCEENIRDSISVFANPI
jgi:hypothetical protein